jgi:hypothetical protein
MAEIKLDVSGVTPNSHKYREAQAKAAEAEREHLKPLVKKDAVVSTKKSAGRKFVDTFIQEDAEDIKSYVVFDVIIPGIKNLILDMVEMAFFGSTSASKRDRSKSGEPTNYRSYYGGSTRSTRERRESRDRGAARRADRDDKLDYQNIILRYREDAENIIDEMRYRIKKTGSCSIAELFDLIGEAGSWNDNNWGWTDERDICLRRVSNGYLISVAEAYYLE